MRVALIGYKFMGKAHSAAYRDVIRYFSPPVEPVMQVITGRNEEGVKKAKEQFGWEEYSTSWEEVVKREDIQIVDISTPNSTHHPIALACAREKKHVICEKPLAMNLSQAKEMYSAVEEAGVVHMVCFNYRRVPAVTLAKKLIQEGRLGKIYHFRATYLQDWIVDENFPLVWRLRKETAGSGAHGDLNAHIIDLARYLVGEFSRVIGMMKTFIKRRRLPDKPDAFGEVTVDDATLFLAEFENGAVGTFEATRFATGRKNYNRFEINGSKGSLVFNLERMNELELYLRDDSEHIQGFRKILVTQPIHPYMEGWWPPGHIIGYQHTFVHTILDFLEGIAKGESPQPNFYDGMRCQEVLEAVERSWEKKEWVEIGR